jgi:hypothetical protein
MKIALQAFARVLLFAVGVFLVLGGPSYLFCCRERYGSDFWSYFTSSAVIAVVLLATAFGGALCVASFSQWGDEPKADGPSVDIPEKR